MGRLNTVILGLVCCAIACVAGGCNILGAGAVLADRINPPKIEAAYKGLANESVAIMVWAPRGVRIDYPDIQIDTATAIQNKLTAAQAAKAEELVGTKFPVKPVSIARYQMDNPQAQQSPITEVAPHLAARTGLTRLIYVEIESFSTRPTPGVALFKGTISATLRVIEIKDGKARSAFDEPDVHAVYPPKAPEEGTMNGNDLRMYAGSIDELTTEIVKQFITHDTDEYH